MGIGLDLLHWYSIHKRDLPWRNTRDPYAIWLSEIILQQTRVEQGLPYFNRFIEAFPTVQDLASASEDKVLKLWQGLGYYSRARNLQKAAKYIVKQCEGVFPSNYAELLNLPGVGPYTAAAIASFAYNEAVAVVDGNVYRFLSRLYAIGTPIPSSAAHNEFKAIAEQLMPQGKADEFNQAMMEMGALICTPKQMQCDACPVNHYCLALKQNRVAELPVKATKTKVKTIYLNFLHFRYQDRLYIQKRDSSSIWKGLYQFPLYESSEELTTSSLKKQLIERYHLAKFTITETVAMQHLLSHRKIEAKIWQIELAAPLGDLKNDIFEIGEAEWETYPVPRLLDNYWREFYVSK
ncbi:MAG: A/G-specific adenine glycosylase [Bacteroidetes bacterium]|nr:MAG: A/G-specific adenine glycosylase [Bacteroidota bacterium]